MAIRQDLGMKGDALTAPSISHEKCLRRTQETRPDSSNLSWKPLSRLRMLEANGAEELEAGGWRLEAGTQGQAAASQHGAGCNRWVACSLPPPYHVHIAAF